VKKKIAGLHPAARHCEKYASDLQSVLGEGVTEANEEASERNSEPRRIGNRHAKNRMVSRQSCGGD
jgi:hypothetical protein